MIFRHSIMEVNPFQFPVPCHEWRIYIATHFVATSIGRSACCASGDIMARPGNSGAYYPSSVTVG